MIRCLFIHISLLNSFKPLTNMTTISELKKQLKSLQDKLSTFEESKLPNKLEWKNSSKNFKEFKITEIKESIERGELLIFKDGSNILNNREISKAPKRILIKLILKLNPGPLLDVFLVGNEHETDGLGLLVRNHPDLANQIILREVVPCISKLIISKQHKMYNNLTMLTNNVEVLQHILQLEGKRSVMKEFKTLNFSHSYRQYTALTHLLENEELIDILKDIVLRETNEDKLKFFVKHSDNKMVATVFEDIVFSTKDVLGLAKECDELANKLSQINSLSKTD